ncbi:ABC transporter substrate-binding protein [Pistricoccus aurantiacus]|uniref:ABC transporter substrate-binding protein n=1 Tax=Pistricoccus aurantiacus TaxID=1883414 RepID=A0A5B8SP09_9GAMM|nr:ABC transporter substrate-binding protein [Pistricoccus aurantiacus]QEA38902.1 ABC transporter substrate-binding protein [Pistricoccus aurantiacus]
MKPPIDKNLSAYPDAIRRRLLLGGLGLGGMAVLGISPLGTIAANESEELTFAFGPDDSGSLQALIKAFNQQYEGRIRVRYQVMPRSTNDFYRQLVSDFEVDARRIDVFGGDMVWTAAFASRGYVTDLTARFNDVYSPGDFLNAPLDSAGYRNRLWGVPWFTAAGMLYYRRDLLESAGHDKPPATWDELARMASDARDKAGTKYGFVFQGAQYEGGVASMLEFLWSAGGRVLTGNLSTAAAFGMDVSSPNVIMINSADSARGVSIARELIESGVVPREVANFREEDTTRAFLNGDAVFMRSWPFVYGLIDEEGSRLSADQVGIAPIPRVNPERNSYSCLGGWNLMINARSSKQDAAWEFIRFAASAERQKQRARDGGFLPTLEVLYDDEQLLEQVPVMTLGRRAIDDARLRPVTPYYAAMSQRLAIGFNRVLRGELTGQQAVRQLQRELQLILDRRG